ncbi:Uncharacterised protein [Mycobacteroides abscessus subsp. bolletii]|uniref:hypothetical protein n=2 Tax=Mycobacteroides abscessus TaxID=36809 RepID=UPI0005DB410A|nr:hypothetical protein [Mycobacteroides abscessus]SKG78566.1 Uncharacterised protein [Mycobacteroides abscessus subsp. bolletii]CPS04128.1 Uncharacterised protein [Mycobacteroides abscessus]CPS05607.1 Uncharacterised protein [Mycobacteroides abscessus]CPS68117.1 Uncharacterised protein [Mycobacteroides abscessus]CPV16939.1 Uncharacterised protein [Mycobacteroides abscessus]
MSKKLTKTQGLVQTVPMPKDVAWATKVTGRNLGAVTYMLSLSCEKKSKLGQLTVTFKEDGSLRRIRFRGTGVVVYPGTYLVYVPSTGNVHVVPAKDYKENFGEVIDRDHVFAGD